LFSAPATPRSLLPVFTLVVPCAIVKLAVPTTKPKMSSDAEPAMRRSTPLVSPLLKAGSRLPVAVAQLIFCVPGVPPAAVALFTDTVPAAFSFSPSMPMSEAPASETSRPR
jgi:hypothetical protein